MTEEVHSKDVRGHLEEGLTRHFESLVQAGTLKRLFL